MGYMQIYIGLGLVMFQNVCSRPLLIIMYICIGYSYSIDIRFALIQVACLDMCSIYISLIKGLIIIHYANSINIADNILYYPILCIIIL